MTETQFIEKFKQIFGAFKVQKPSDYADGFTDCYKLALDALQLTINEYPDVFELSAENSL